MKMTSWFLFLAALLAHLAHGQDFELVASSQFEMILGPVQHQLGEVDIQVLEDAMGAVLLAMVSQDDDFMDIEVVVQKVHFPVAYTNEEGEALADHSQIQFFVLATTAADTGTSRTILNEMLQESVFDTKEGNDFFFDFLGASGRLVYAYASSVEVNPITSPPSENDTTPDETSDNSSNRHRRLSTLDLVLISISGLIFIGIVYMIWQHHKDRGYIENQRMLAANQRIRDTYTNDEDEEDSTPKSIQIFSKLSKADDNGSHEDEAPSTPSTIHSNDAQTTTTTPNPRILSPPVVVRPSYHQQQQQLQAMTPEALLSASSMDGASVHSITESLDGNIWFGTTSRTSHHHHDEGEGSFSTGSFGALLQEASSTGAVGNTSSYDEGLDSEENEGSDGDDDVFYVDVENSSSTRHQAQRSSNKAAISDWMKTIRVVSSPAKTSEMTQSSHETFESSPSLALTTPEDGTALEHRSLEGSMASSAPGSATKSRTRRPDIVEV